MRVHISGAGTVGGLHVIDSWRGLAGEVSIGNVTGWPLEGGSCAFLVGDAGTEAGKVPRAGAIIDGGGHGADSWEDGSGTVDSKRFR